MVNYEYPPLGGGGGVAAANLASALVSKGHHVDYITTHFKGLARNETIGGVHLHRVTVPGRTHLQTAGILSMLTFPAAAVHCARKLARAGRYDVLHSHFAIPSGPAGYLLSRAWGLPHIVSVYGGDIYDPSKRYSPHRHPVLKIAVKRVLNQASVIVPESEDLCERTQKFYSPGTPIERIPLGFVPTPFRPMTREALGLREDRVYAIAVSRLVARKGYGDLLTALHQANVPGLELLIAGDGPEEAVMRAQCSELGIGNRVHFLGHVSDEAKYQYLNVANFFALASHHEGFGIVFQEAMHCGLPIATTNEGGQTDFLHEELNALLTPPRAPEALAESLRRLATDSALRERMRANNLRDIQEHLIDTVAEAYLRLYYVHCAAGNSSHEKQ